MKRKTTDDGGVFAKKQKVVELTKAQQIMADINLPKFLNEGKTDLVKAALELAFSTPKKVETLLAYTNYQMFWWAIEHQDIELMQYVLSKTTERGKFLIVCHNNYELLKKFVDLGIQKIQDDTYQAFQAVKILEVLVNANPSTSYLIIDSVKRFIDEKNLDATKNANILKEDFQTIFPNFIEENDDYKINEIPNVMPSSCEAGLEQELVGDLPHIVDYFYND